MGNQVDAPIGVSPTAMQRMAHADGECATAKACQQTNSIMILSTISTSSIEQVNQAAPKAIKWFQLYVYKNREITKNLIKRAEKNGFSAIVLTIDAPAFGTRFQDIRNNFHLPENLRMANFDQGLEASDLIQKQFNGASGINEYVKSQFDPSLTWDILTWLKKQTNLSIVVKGILTGIDAIEAINNGADAILVSNHGGRQLDTVPSTIEVLPEVIEAVKGKVEIYLDGGIRCGTDVFKALALGAKSVFIGRPVIWGLCYDGANGVENVLKILRNELDMAMLLSGCLDINQNKQTFYYHSRLL